MRNKKSILEVIGVSGHLIGIIALLLSASLTCWAQVNSAAGQAGLITHNPLSVLANSALEIIQIKVHLKRNTGNLAEPKSKYPP